MLLRRWLADCAVAVIVVALSGIFASGGRKAPGVRDILGDVLPFSRSAAGLVVRTVWPIGPPVAGIVLIAAIVLFALRRGLPKSIGQPQELRTWCWVAALALVATIFAFGPLVGSALHPLSEGTAGRGNVAVVLPLCVFVFAAVAILTRLILPRRV